MNQMYPGSATSFTSGMGREEHTQRWARVRDANGSVALVFVTPEKVGKSGKFKGEMEKLYSAGRLGRFVIGEASMHLIIFIKFYIGRVRLTLKWIILF